MTTATFAATRKTHSVGDTFAYGVMIMLVINLGQRVVGLLRNLGFCQFLSDADLGQWALANSFFVLAAPLAVLGLPGSFGKFAEIFRQRSCLPIYLKRVGYVCVASGLLLVTIMLMASDSFSWLVYGIPTAPQVVAWTAIALLAQIGYNFVYDVTLSLRHVRVLSWMQFANGICFAFFGILGLFLTHSWTLLLPSYALACVAGMVVGGFFVWRNSREDLTQSAELPMGEMWSRIIPFAIALWVSNLLAGSFELSDRYMLLHLTPGDEQVGQAMVGQYYCGRIFPNLLTSFALMLTGMLLPYLSADWEAGRFQDIQRRMRNVLILVSIVFTSISVVVLLASPLLFEWLFAGRYQAAQSILGLSFLQCVWASVTYVAGAYLLCAEKAKAASFNLAMGLLVNLMLNVPLIQQFGLTGSVVATLIANLVVLILTLRSLCRSGCSLDRRAIGLILFPGILLLGCYFAIVGLAFLVVAAGRTEWILQQRDRDDLDALVLPKLKKWNIPIDSLWPTAQR